MNVIVACECSGVVRDAFRKLGHDAWSNDLEGVEPEGRWSNYHLYGDCRLFLSGSSMPVARWDLLIAHPPCTYLCNSGVRWLHKAGQSKTKLYGRKRWAAMHSAAILFRELLDAPVEMICVENAIMHRHAKKIIGRFQDQTVQPWQFGHGEVKRTCLWLERLPCLKPTKLVKGREARVHKMSPSPDRGKQRSVTYQGIADAMAQQWGVL